MNLLVAVDLSEATAKVLEAAGTLAQRQGSAICILHVAEPEPDFVGYATASAAIRSTVAKEFRREHRAVQELADRLREQGVDATALLIRGPTVESILREAERMKAQMIVVGTHGHGAVYTMLVGSVSAGVIRKASVPVVVVPTR